MNTSRLALCRVIIFACLILPASTPHAHNRFTTSVGITNAAFDLTCIRYRVTGVCLWMTCTLTPPACTFDYSIKVRHNVPEVVATSYPTLGYSPWIETSLYAPRTAWAHDGGSATDGFGDREEAMRFKNVDIIGSPSTYLYFVASQNSAVPICAPATWGYQPYFLSTLDYNWRDPLIETPWTLLNLLTGVNAGLSWFEGLFPRIGFVDQGHDYKAALVAAKRGVDIVRQGNQPHVYFPMTTSGIGQGWWPPGEQSPFLWQQLVPKHKLCAYLPDLDDSLMVLDPYADRLNEARGNAWQLWRGYACCQRAGQILVFHAG